MMHDIMFSYDKIYFIFLCLMFVLLINILEKKEKEKRKRSIHKIQQNFEFIMRGGIKYVCGI